MTSILLACTGLIGCGSSAEFKALTGVQLLAQAPIPYDQPRETYLFEADTRQIGSAILPNGDLAVVRSFKDTAIIERYDGTTLGVKWRKATFIGESKTWIPRVHVTKTGSLSINILNRWEREYNDTTGVQAIELDAETGKTIQDKWLLKFLTDRTSLALRSRPLVLRSQDRTKTLVYYTDYTNVIESDDDDPKSVDVVYSLYDSHFKLMREGRIRCPLPQDVDNDKEDIPLYFRGVTLSDAGDIYALSVKEPNKIRITKVNHATGKESTLEEGWEKIDVLEDDETFGGMACEFDSLGNAYFASARLIDQLEAGGIVLGYFDFNSMKVPFASKIDLETDDDLERYKVERITLHEGNIIVHFEHIATGLYTDKNDSYYIHGEGDVLLMGFDTQGNPKYNTWLKKRQSGINDVGYRIKREPGGLRFLYLDREAPDRVLSRYFDVNRGTLGPKKEMFSLNRIETFLNKSLEYDSKSNSYYVVFWEGTDAEYAKLLKFGVDEKQLQNLEE